MACPPRDAFQIGWICALPIEAAAAKEMLDENFGTLDAQDPADTNAYTLGRIGKHHVVIACLPGGQYGTTPATTVANHMIRTFSKSLRIGLMVGVGGAIPSVTHDIRLGDIVISCPDGISSGVLQYDMGKIGADGEFQRTGSLNSPPRSLLTALNLMRAAEFTDDPLYTGYILQSTERTARTRKTFLRPGANQDRLFKVEYNHPENSHDCDTCPTEWEERRSERQDITPQPHYGIIASGNAVIKDARTREQLRLKTGALCFEMEAAGLMMDFPCIVIRGICDYADTHKNKQWQGYAALAAASYAKELLSYMPAGLVLQEQLAIHMYGELKEEVGRISLRLDQAKDQREKHRHEEMTRNLRDQQQRCHQVFKIGNYTEQKDINPMRAEGTCNWVFSSSEYLQWKNSNRNDLLWVSADPGCGKSVLARSIIDSYLQASSPTVTICYFFFKDNEGQDNLAAALCSVLHQLFSQRPHLLHHAMLSWERSGQALQKEVNELWQILITAASSDPPFHTICILDALDECCDIDQDRLIQNLKSFYHKCQPTYASQDSCLKFLVTSRPYDQIRSHFRSTTNFSYLHLKGEDENEKIHQEIDSVIKIRMRTLAEAVSMPCDLQLRLETQLLEMENRTYLWLHLAFVDIRSTFQQSLWPEDESIRMIPSSVNMAYEKVLRQVPRGQLSTVKKIFQIIIAARYPLKTEELAMALGISLRPSVKTAAEARISPLGFDIKLRDLCGLFVFVNNSKVYFIHQTAREYLIKGLAASHPLSCSLQGAENQMAQVCLKYLSMKELENIEAEKHILFSDLLLYSAIFWADHVRRMSSAEELEVKDLLHHLYDTTTKRFLLWFPHFWAIMGFKGPEPTLTATHLAALNGHQNMLLRLLDEGQLKPNVADSVGSYPLTYASFMGHHKTAVILIEHGGDINAQGGPYSSPLQAACLSGREKIVQMLLTSGADANTETKEHEKAICIACIRGHGRIVQILLDFGADANTQAKDGTHILKMAFLGRHDNILHMLLMSGADVNVKDEHDTTVLEYAFLSKNDGIMHQILKHVADVNEICGTQRILQWACLERREKTLQMLLNCGIYLNSEDEDRKTALIHACRTKIAELHCFMPVLKDMKGS
ncbi:unnamed protein product [Penicillium bialowiezense]